MVRGRVGSQEEEHREREEREEHSPTASVGCCCSSSARSPSGHPFECRVRGARRQEIKRVSSSNVAPSSPPSPLLIVHTQSEIWTLTRAIWDSPPPLLPSPPPSSSPLHQRPHLLPLPFSPLPLTPPPHLPTQTVLPTRNGKPSLANSRFQTTTSTPSSSPDSTGGL